MVLPRSETTKCDREQEVRDRPLLGELSRPDTGQYRVAQAFHMSVVMGLPVAEMAIVVVPMVAVIVVPGMVPVVVAMWPGLTVNAYRVRRGAHYAEAAPPRPPEPPVACLRQVAADPYHSASGNVAA